MNFDEISWVENQLRAFEVAESDGVACWKTFETVPLSPNRPTLMWLDHGVADFAVLPSRLVFRRIWYGAQAFDPRDTMGCGAMLAWVKYARGDITLEFGPGSGEIVLPIIFGCVRVADREQFRQRHEDHFVFKMAMPTT